MMASYIKRGEEDKAFSGLRYFLEVARGAAPAYSNFNPKSEYRISKQFQNKGQNNPMFQNQKLKFDVLNFPRLRFVLAAVCFGFRVSDFGFSAP
jgi:hypothetical protein